MKTLLSKNSLFSGIFLSLLLCFSLVVAVNAEDEIWGQTYGDSGYLDDAFALVETSDGGYALAGHKNLDAFNSSSDFWLVKTDVHGNMEWNQTYGKSGESQECVTSLVEASDGGYVLAGFTAPVEEDCDVWLVKTDSLGNVEWNQTYGGEQNDAAFSLVETTDGGYALAGMYNSVSNIAGAPSYGHESFFNRGGSGWLAKVDSGGNMEWNRTYGGPDYVSFYTLVVTSDGGYALAGRYGNGDCWLVKVDSGGNMEWDKKYDQGSNRGFYSLVVASDGGFALAGVYGGWGYSDFWLVKTDSLGNIEWDQTYGGTGDDWAYSVVEGSDGGYVMAGIWDFSEDYLIGYHSTGSFWIVKANEYGVMEWNRTYGGLGEYDYDWAYALVATSDGGYAIAGVASHSPYHRDFWLIKTDEEGVAPVVPEATWVILPLLVIATVFISISKKKLLRKNLEAQFS